MAPARRARSDRSAEEEASMKLQGETEIELRSALQLTDELLEQYTVEQSTGYCIACRNLTILVGGRTPSVADGEPHLARCPIGRRRAENAKLAR
jgi:hypothetical protein